jgi:PLP dependent protein
VSNPSLESRLEEVYQRIDAAARQSGRTAETVTLIAVTKTFPIEFVCKACASGLQHIGENRVQEVVDKFGDGQVRREYPELTLHLIGHLQSNKVRKAVQIVNSIDSVDSVDLALEINRESARLNKTLRVLLEVNTSGETQKFGLSPADALDATERMLKMEHLNVCGLMTVGPLTDDPSAVRHSFELLRNGFEDIRLRLAPPSWSVLSMGMSGDYEIAIEEGATEIRLGTALFGDRSLA